MATTAESVWRCVDAEPDRVALRGPDGAWSYRFLRDRAAALGGCLAESGVLPGDRVLLVVPTVPEFVAAYLGAHAAGAIVVAASPSSTRHELDHLMDDAACASVLAWHDAGPAAEQAAVAAGVPFRTLRPGLTDVTTEPVTPYPAEPEDTAVILYTSGTTGRPKGAELTHANLVACAEIFADVLRVEDRDVFGTALPLYHIFGQAVVIGTALRAGISVSLLPRFDAGDLLELIGRDGVTVLFGVPTMYNALLQGETGSHDFSRLRLAGSGGASLPAEVMRAFADRFGCIILEGYGLTETTGAATFNGLDRVRKPGAVGIPLPGVQVRIVDPGGVDVGVGEVGEVLVQGPVVMKGYWNRPDDATLTDGWLRTGDLATRDADGDIRIVDRVKDMIIRGGHNVYPREVEEVLYEHPDIVEVAVVGVPDDHYGQEVGAVIAPRPGAEMDLAELRLWTKKRLSPYKVPRAFRLVDALPRGTTGKIQKRSIDLTGFTTPSAG
ncbi:AMP-binding protein [Qaidamihabitans albus]|uniref:AMP-binding protein n=1 Tax=Qaidamihabitans albus TaxID=2795733 RepID=UPI0018F237B5|nr:AMP-binding protein [Qaidamihabitans albus]